MVFHQCLGPRPKPPDVNEPVLGASITPGAGAMGPSGAPAGVHHTIGIKEHVATLAKAESQPRQRSEAHLETVLRIIRDTLGRDPLALREAVGNKPGDKDAVRKLLPKEFTEEIFRKTWKSLLRDGRIAYAAR